MKSELIDLDKHIPGEFYPYDKDRQVYYFKSGMRIVGKQISNRDFASSQTRNDWLRACRLEYYKERFPYSIFNGESE